MHRKGFTLLELIIVIVILGILTTFAVPRYFKQVERARAASALQLIGTIRSAEVMYKAENGAYAPTGACSTATLDVNFTTPQGFDAPQCTEAATEDAELVSITRDLTNINNPIAAEPYKLAINGNGAITCSAGTQTCAVIGY